MVKTLTLSIKAAAPISLVCFILKGFTVFSAGIAVNSIEKQYFFNGKNNSVYSLLP